MLLGCPFSTVGITETVAISSANAFPNPASDFITLTGFAANEVLAIYSAQGQLVLRGVSGSTINISEFPAGLYVVRAKSQSTRFVKQ
jgi:hypothetical protein